MSEYISDQHQPENRQPAISATPSEIPPDYSRAASTLVDPHFKELSLWEALGLLLVEPQWSLRQFINIILDRDQKPAVKDVKSTSPISSAQDRWQAMDEALVAYKKHKSDDESDDLPSGDSPHSSTAIPPTDSLDSIESWRKRMSISRDALRPNRENLAISIILISALVFAAVGGLLLRKAAIDFELREAGNLNGSPFWFWLAGFAFLMGIVFQSRWVKNQVKNIRSGEFSLRNFFVTAQPTIQSRVIPFHFRFNRKAIVRDIYAFFERHAVRFAIMPIALLFAWSAYDSNVVINETTGLVENVAFTEFGFFSWVMAIFLWYLALGVDLNARLGRVLRRGSMTKTPFLLDDQGNLIPTDVKPARKIKPQKTLWKRLTQQIRWTHFVLLLIVILAAYLRLHRLDEAPPDMTSDHIEKLIDAYKVSEGNYAVFFENNGGREAFQMYVVAAIADWFDVGYSFRALKYATIIEGVLAVFLIYWLGKTFIGTRTEQQRQFGDWVGLAMAGLLAISSWHLMLSRLGLRINLTPLTTIIVAIFLIRAVRYNRRLDYINLGLALGVGMYLYQSNRMLPLMVGAMIGVAAIFYLFNDLRKRHFPIHAWLYGINLTTAAVLTLVIYLPMYRYSQEFPDAFWNRTYGRIFGADDPRDTRCTDADNDQVMDNEDYCPYLAGPRENYGCPLDASIPPTPPLLYVEPFVRPESTMAAIERFNETQFYDEACAPRTGLEMLEQNYENAVVMYMWEGDEQWISNGSLYPALDDITNGLLILGLLAWVILTIQQRDLALLLVPIGIFIMLLPSTLSVFYYSENPSFTRASGTLPFIFFLAALPLAWLLYQLSRVGRNPILYHSFAFIALAVVLYSAGKTNYETYFEVYRVGYEQSWLPYAEVSAPMREFAETDGAYSNAFYIHTAHWLDGRILALSAGDTTWMSSEAMGTRARQWPNGVWPRERIYNIIAENQGTPYQYDPTKPLLFYIHPQDIESIEFFDTYFPNGELRTIQITRRVGSDFYVYEVPPGWEWMGSQMSQKTQDVSCIINCRPGP